MASGPITSRQIHGETMETVTDFIFLGSKITVDGDYSHEIKRHFLCGRKAMTNLDSILKSRDITLPTKVCIVKSMVFPVVMYECESWIINKAEHRRTDAFELWCWRRLSRVPWTARRSNQAILREINPELEGLMLKLKLQYFGHLWQGTDSLEKNLMLGKIEGRRRRGWQRMNWLNGITDLMDEFKQAPGVGDGQGNLVCCSPWGRKELDTTEWLNWTELDHLLSKPLHASLPFTGTSKWQDRHGCFFLPQGIALNIKCVSFPLTETDENAFPPQNNYCAFTD